MKSEKSRSRLYFYAMHLIFVITILIIMMPNISAMTSNIIFIFSMISALSVVLIRCEKCHTHLYMRGDEGIGAPQYDYFIQAKKCPRCGVERI